MKFQKISHNDLGELLELLARIQGEIKNFCHVSDHLPQSFKNSVNSLSDKLVKESIRREDEYYELKE